MFSSRHLSINWRICINQNRTPLVLLLMAFATHNFEWRYITGMILKSCAQQLLCAAIFRSAGDGRSTIQKNSERFFVLFIYYFEEKDISFGKGRAGWIPLSLSTFHWSQGAFCVSCFDARQSDLLPWASDWPHKSTSFSQIKSTLWPGINSKAIDFS